MIDRTKRFSSLSEFVPKYNEETQLFRTPTFFPSEVLECFVDETELMSIKQDKILFQLFSRSGMENMFHILDKTGWLVVIA